MPATTRPNEPDIDPKRHMTTHQVSRMIEQHSALHYVFDKNAIKQSSLEAQKRRSRARALSDRKSNRIRAPRISPNIMHADVPAQSEGYPD